MRKSEAKAAGLVLALILGIARLTLFAAPAFHPAKYLSGSVPPLPPPTVVGGGEVMLELDVTSTGVVRGAKVLRTTPPYGDALVTAAKTWRFTPAEMEKDPPPASPTESKWKPVDSTILLVSIVRPPAFYSGPTLGPASKNVGAAGEGTPFPTTTGPASYPPQAHQGGLVLIETTINVDGRPTESRMLRSDPPFDRAALEALGGWRFRAARVAGSTTPVFAYVAFGFREPVGVQPPCVPTPAQPCSCVPAPGHPCPDPGPRRP
jgi:TonB family protein